MLSKLNIFSKSDVLKNSFWGLLANIIQNVFLSIFFIVIARFYSTTDFAHYLIANTLYQFIATFSALGLGQWFIREIVVTKEKTELINRFVKIQFYFGAFFFLLNFLLGFVLYSDPNIRILTMLFGINILFDNIIYSIRHINIAENEQKKTFIISIIEAITKFIIACLLFAYPFSIVTLTVILIVIRFGTLNLFLKIGSPRNLNLNNFWKSKIYLAQVKELIFNNWRFIVIGSVAIIYWRIATIIISKVLTVEDVAHYEISYKLFSLAQLLPFIVSATVFPKLIELYKSGAEEDFRNLYKRIFKLYLLFGLLAFSFVYAFADFLVPLAFGPAYVETSFFTKQMFLTILVFPTAYLQANVLIAMRMERYDMWFNILSLVLNIIIIFTGLYFVKSLSVINYSIFFSFLAFHISQDILLIRKGISTYKETFLTFVIAAASIIGFIALSKVVEPYLVFVGAWFVFLFLILPNTKEFKNLLAGLRSN